MIVTRVEVSEFSVT